MMRGLGNRDFKGRKGRPADQPCYSSNWLTWALPWLVRTMKAHKCVCRQTSTNCDHRPKSPSHLHFRVISYTIRRCHVATAVEGAFSAVNKTDFVVALIWIEWNFMTQNSHEFQYILSLTYIGKTECRRDHSMQTDPKTFDSSLGEATLELSDTSFLGFRSMSSHSQIFTRPGNQSSLKIKAVFIPWQVTSYFPPPFALFLSRL